MSDRQNLLRRDFLRFTAGSALAATIYRGNNARGAEADVAVGKASRETELNNIILKKTIWLADRFVDWQNSYGRLDAARAPQAINDSKFFVLCYVAASMYRAFELTGNLDHKKAADRYWFCYLAIVGNCDPKLGARFDSARAGMGLIPYRDFRRHNPRERKLRDAANSLYARMMDYSWDKGSFLQNGYPTRDGSGMDAANSCDNAASGCGMMSYYAISKRADVLSAAEQLALYFLTECEPGTYKGVWSTPRGNWVIAPTMNTIYEHLSTPASQTCWAWTTIEAIYFLTELHSLTKKDGLKQGIKDKCVLAMRWWFDECQFDDGACGIAGRDDKWLGLTAAATMTYLRVRDAGFLDKELLDTYRPKALAARTWVLGHIDDDCLQRGGYYRVTGHSQPRPKCNLTWLFGWTLESLPSLHLI